MASAAVGIKDRILSFDRALKASELSKLLSVDRDTIYEQAKHGYIPSFRVGSPVRFDPKALAEWFDRQ